MRRVVPILWFIGFWGMILIVLLSVVRACPGATATARREMVTTASIEGIIWGVVKGAVSDGITGIGQAGTSGLPEILQRPSLQIDGRPRSGFTGWAEAVWRVTCYAFTGPGEPGADAVVGGGRGENRESSDNRRSGNAAAGDGLRGSRGCVKYTYRLHVRGCNVRRETRISDGEILLTTDVSWVEVVPVGRSTREVPINVSIIIRATERGAQTYLLGTARGYADTRDFRCSIVRSIAERRAAEELQTGLAAVLLGIEIGGRRYYSGAMSTDAAEIVAAVRAAIRIGRVRL
jgi:hypothetical protein